jgi:DNA-directed RNA polymerase specialized sigma24 family protein
MPRITDPDGALFEQLRPRLKAISLRIVGSEAEAEDIVQDCFLKWHGAEQAALAAPAAWLTTVVQHQSIDCLRKRARDTVAARTAMELMPDVQPALPEEGLLRCALNWARRLPDCWHVCRHPERWRWCCMKCSNASMPISRRCSARRP